jgi:hypothetical protein
MKDLNAKTDDDDDRRWLGEVQIPEGDWYHVKFRERIMDAIRLRKLERLPQDRETTQVAYSSQ